MAPASVPLREVARVFLVLGCTAFGGPAGHIALMHEQLVRRRGWLTPADFADLLGATNLIPGPNSTEMALHIGRRIAGWRGLLAAGLCFILPSALLVSAAAFAYVRYGRTPDARAAMAGIAPVVIAILVHATWRLSRSVLRTPALWVVAAGAGAMALAGVHELLILAAGAIALLPGRRAAGGAALALAASAAAGAQAVPIAVTASGAASVPLASLALFFLKVGSILFGSGYVLIAFLRADLVQRWHWLTDQQLVDAVAIGQFTPGPLSTTATFIGYLLAGWPGAVVCTVAMFLPAFVFVAVTQPLIPRLRRSTAAAAALDGVVAASLGLMAAVACTLARTSLASPRAWLISAAALLVLARHRHSSVWLVIAGALIGLLWLSGSPLSAFGFPL